MKNFLESKLVIKFLKEILEEDKDIESETSISFLQKCAVSDAITLIEELSNQLEIAKRVIKGDITELDKLEI